jgi:hypothetical protein
MKYQVTCKVKYEEHERISEIGCVDQSGTQRRFKEDEAINLIEMREAEFYVDRPEGHTVRVIVAVSPQGHKFLKTEADGEKPNNLLSLPTCKAHVAPQPPPRAVVPAHSHAVC